MNNSVGVSGYSGLSILVHWIGAICVISLFVTHEAERGSVGAFYHVSIGALIGLFLLWRVFRRIHNGFTQETNQHFLLNLLSKIVHWGLLAVIVVVVLTGYLLPWSRGAALDVAGLFSIPSPFAGSRGFHEFIEETHDIAGHLFMPLIALHILGVIKHLVIDRGGLLMRMIRPVSNGR